MPSSRTQLGDLGEQAAIKHLRTLGYEIMLCKWRCPHGEIDIIARDRSELVIIEVRTRRGKALPEESVDLSKQQKLITLAYTYIDQQALPEETAWRIDVIAVNLDHHGKLMRLEHIQNAIEEAL